MINDALRLMRVFHNIKQGDLADSLDISQSHLSEIEAGRKQPTFELLEKYSLVFKMPVSSIVFFAEEKDRKSAPNANPEIAKKALQMLNWVDAISGG